MHLIFNGPPGSGKDEACGFLRVNHGYRHIQFKDQLFIDTTEFFGVSLTWFMKDYDNRELKEKPYEQLNGMSKRQALIHVSENVIKPKYGSDYFGIKAAERIDLASSYCFSDGGFLEEITPVINTVGQDNLCIVQLYRAGCSFHSDSRNYIHGILQEEFGTNHETQSQSIEPQIPIRMYRVYNNSSVSDFHQIIRKILGKEANANKKITNLLRKSV
jgi:hypothetical protein